MDLTRYIIGIASIIIGCGFLVMSYGLGKLAKSGKIQSDSFKALTLPSGAKVSFVTLAGITWVAAGILFVIIGAII